jgi:hypothetical protein
VPDGIFHRKNFFLTFKTPWSGREHLILRDSVTRQNIKSIKKSNQSFLNAR